MTHDRARDNGKRRRPAIRPFVREQHAHVLERLEGICCVNLQPSSGSLSASYAVGYSSDWQLIHRRPKPRRPKQDGVAVSYVLERPCGEVETSKRRGVRRLVADSRAGRAPVADDPGSECGVRCICARSGLTGSRRETGNGVGLARGSARTACLDVSMPGSMASGRRARPQPSADDPHPIHVLSVEKRRPRARELGAIAVCRAVHPSLSLRWRETSTGAPNRAGHSPAPSGTAARLLSLVDKARRNGRDDDALKESSQPSRDLRQLGQQEATYAFLCDFSIHCRSVVLTSAEYEPSIRLRSSFRKGPAMPESDAVLRGEGPCRR